MWTKIAHLIIKYRLTLIIVLGVVTAYMGYRAQDVHMAYTDSKVVPADDPDMVYFKKFQSLFGQDANMMVLGVKDSALYGLENFRRFKELSDQLVQLDGIDNVLSLPELQMLVKDPEQKKFVNQSIFKKMPEDQHSLGSLLQIARNQKVYSGQLLNEENGATVLLLIINKDVLNTPARIDLVYQIMDTGKAFSDDSGIQLHYAGLPYVRTVMANMVKQELNFFLILSALVTSLILYFFFRDWRAVLFPMIVIAVVVIWVVGTLAILNYEMTVLTGLLPPIIVVIGIPNCIYLLNKYHQEYSKHGNKMRALSRIVRNVGIVTLVTNFTTAIGFLVLGFADITILRQFGVVAGINIMATFVVSIILIPAVFSYLRPPSGDQLNHLDFGFIRKMLNWFNTLVHQYSHVVFFVTAILLAVSIYGINKVESVSYMVDDIPDDSQIKTDLAFFEDNFKGVMPLELVVDTGKKKGVMNLSNLRKIDRLQNYLTDQEYISEPISVINFVKASRQAFYNDNPNFYALPTNQDKNFILRYLKDEDSDLINNFVDSTGQLMRVSLKVADIGSKKLDTLVNANIAPKIKEILGDKMSAKVTGTTLLFVKGNSFLIHNLKTSLVLAFVIIALIMAVLFRNARMVIISLLPNVVPLLITGALMGFFNIPLKPSTVLIFSIAFGISVDDSIHFLAKYRQELFANNFFVPIALTKSLRETGASMMYTSIVLFFGFVIFAGSDFGGTVALGVLTSTTLLIAMFTNLILLPSLLFAFDDGKRRKDRHPLIENYPEFYEESEDEEIDLNMIRLQKKNA
ncbi:efflux RND transporter permease subunit [Xanthovirga aplysinae]|uniref:efflux RND transporter permease subunit n=1 Tax=Xanthovirga aplysinae TaxID=2529853 RepID=UPI0012BBB8BA|nr:efflux RND transporter permease subunit [Xanthovirga aplysinae]MTI33043.1 hypothetical protein [Xanthovirga aplysinae]